MRLSKTILTFAFLAFAVPGCSFRTAAQTPDISASHGPIGILGVIAAVHPSSIVVKNDAGNRIVDIFPTSHILRPFPISLRQLHVGDDVMVWYASEVHGVAVASEIVVSPAKWGGRITAVHQQSLVLKGDGGPGNAPGRVVVLLDKRTTYIQGKPRDLSIGRFVEVTGSCLGPKRMQASAVDVWLRE